MGLFKSKAPPPPDYAALAEKQGEANVEAAQIAGRLSNPNIYTPYGSREVTFGGSRMSSGGGVDDSAYQKALDKYNNELSNYTPYTRVGLGRVFNQKPIAPNRDDYATFDNGSINYDPNMVTINERLTPEAQALFDQQIRISEQFGDVAEGGLGRVARAMGQDFDMSQLPEIQGVNADVFSERISPDVMVRDKVEQALLERMNPQLERKRQQQEEALIMQGQGRGGQAWQTAQEDLSRRESDALLSAILGAGQEQSRMYGMEQGELQAAQQAQQALYGAQSQARNRALQEALTLRNLPLTEINALRTGSQPVVPQFQNYVGQNVGAAPVFQAGNMQYQAEVDAVNAKNAQRGQTFGALAGLAGAGFGAAGAAGGFGNLFGGGAGAGAGASYFGGIG